MRRRLHQCAAAALVAAATYAGSVGAGSEPAVAAACPSAEGVTVVVDFHGLGGGIQQVCDAGGGGEKANELFTSNGFALTYVQNQPGFVCRVDALPDDDPCLQTPPPDAYWGLWWSDGSKAKWTYSSLGVGSLEIPGGGSVAFSWNSGPGQDKPGVPPPVHDTEPDPSPSATGDGDGDGGGGNGGGGNGGGNNGGGNGGGTTPSPTPEPSGSTSTQPSESESASPPPTETESGEPSPSESETEALEAGADTETAQTESTASPPDADDGGLPPWAAPVVVVLLFAAAGATVYVRRRGTQAGPTDPAGP